MLGHTYSKCPVEKQRKKEERQKELMVIAAARGELRKVKNLHEQGVSLNSYDMFHMTPLLHASADRATGVFEYIFEHIATDAIDVNFRSNGDVTALHIAAQNGQYKNVSDLLDAGADINSQNRKGFTPLMLAVLWGNEKTVEVLIERGADVDIVRPFQESIFANRRPYVGTALDMAKIKAYNESLECSSSSCFKSSSL
jgi:ankyrin repeat protein